MLSTQPGQLHVVKRDGRVIRYDDSLIAIAINSARVTRLTTPHGEIITPAFMPVGTQAFVNHLTPHDLIHTNRQIILGEPGEVRKSDVFAQFAGEAARQAIEDAGLVIDENNAHRIGVAIGSGIGGLPWIEQSYGKYLEAGPRRISPFLFPDQLFT